LLKKLGLSAVIDHAQKTIKGIERCCGHSESWLQGKGRLASYDLPCERLILWLASFLFKDIENFLFFEPPMTREERSSRVKAILPIQ
jgi:hypothetical protein